MSVRLSLGWNKSAILIAGSSRQRHTLKAILAQPPQTEFGRTTSKDTAGVCRLIGVDE